MTLNIRAACPPVESIHDVQPLRERYLAELLSAQDALLELLVASGTCHAIEVKGERVGYFVLHERTLVEFYLSHAFELYEHILLPQIVADLGIEHALIKSFDHLFLSCALDYASAVSSRGYLMRDLRLRELPKIDRVHYVQRAATLDDLPRLREVRQDVFTHEGRLSRVIEHGQMRLFERDGELVGFGILKPVLPDRPDVEVGIAVDERFRNRGYAIYMLRDLIDHCLARGLNPVCGSARANEASLRMGTRVGLLARYRLIQVTFRNLRSRP